MDSLTIDEFKKALPETLKKTVNDSLRQQINDKLSEPEMYEIYRDNLVGYVSVLTKGKFNLKDYVNAVKYVSFKLTDKTNIAAFTHTFPDKITLWQTEGKDSKEISAYVSAYNKNKLVNLIYEQTLTPAWVLNQDIHQKAINHQFKLMISADSERVQMDAANSLLTHLKPPEAQKVELSLGEETTSKLSELRNVTASLAAQQKASLEAKVINIEEVAASSIVVKDVEDGEFTEVAETP